MAAEYTVGDITVIDPWVRAIPIAAKVGGGFLKIRNRGSTDDKLIAVYTDVAGRAELHTMVIEKGVMKMRKLEKGVSLPSQGHIVLKPGGDHIMFYHLISPFIKGESFKARLEFQKAGWLEIFFSIV